MKHLLLILFVVVAGYVFYSIAPVATRRKVWGFIGLHGMRLGLLLLFVALLILVALNLPASIIF